MSSSSTACASCWPLGNKNFVASSLLPMEKSDHRLARSVLKLRKFSLCHTVRRSLTTKAQDYELKGEHVQVGEVVCAHSFGRGSAQPLDPN